MDKQNQRGHVLAAVLCLQHLNEPFLGAKHAQNALDATHEENERYIPLLLLAVALAQQLNLPTVRSKYLFVKCLQHRKYGKTDEFIDLNCIIH